MSRRDRLRGQMDSFGEERGGEAPFSRPPSDDVLDLLVDSAPDGTPLINVYDIMPDLRQPRRTMPNHIRKVAMRGSAEALHEALDVWRADVGRLLGREVDLAALLSQVDENEALESDHPTVNNYRELVSLAVSIRKDGLINPIHVARIKSGYVIESGERRWLATVLLNQITGDYGQIKAEVRDEVNVWRQASENTARRDLNAIGMARQYALLVMALLRENGERFESYDVLLSDDGNDQAFYAQVAESRIPYGQSQRIYDGLNVSSRESVSYYKKLLSIPSDLWMQADEQDMSLRSILQESGAKTFTKPTPNNAQLSDASDNSGNVVTFPGSGHGSQMSHAVDNPPRRDAGNPFGDAGRMSVPVNRRADRVPPAVPVSSGEYAHSTQPEAGALADVARPLPSAEAYVRDSHIWKQLAHLLALSGQVKGAKALEDLLKIDRASFAGWVEDGEQEVQQMLIRYHGELIDGINGMIESKILPAIMEMLQDANYRDEE